MSLKVFSYGGGWQSNAALVLAARGQLDYKTFLFCNVGDDSEDPLTLSYVREHAMPYAAAHGLELIELRKLNRDGEPQDLFHQLTRTASRSIPIPVHMANGAPGTRGCTATFKIKVIAAWTKAHGATRQQPATVGIGFSLDEIGRIGASREIPHQVKDYPLLDLRIRRSDCHHIITSTGLPMPPKSACWFCPLHREAAWIDMKRDRPELFKSACWLEGELSARRQRLGKDDVYFTRFGVPLFEAIGSEQPTLDYEGQCDSGHCFT